MPIQVFPTPSAGASYSSQPPASASSVLLDGQLVTASSISTSVTGTGAPWLLYANGAGTTTITVGSDTYSVPAGSIVGTSAYTGSQSVSVAAPVNTAFTASTMPSASSWQSVAYGNGYFVAVAQGYTTAGAYSTNGTSWTALRMSIASNWQSVTYGNGYFVAVQNSGSTAGAYFAQSTLPVAYGIYNGATVRA